MKLDKKVGSIAFFKNKIKKTTYAKLDGVRQKSWICGITQNSIVI
jgi:hypothetical protein